MCHSPASNDMNYRPLRVSGLIQEELGKILLQRAEFPGALVTITGVDVSAKLDVAKIKLSVIPVEKDKSVLRTVNAAQKELQHLLIRKLNIKPMPRLMFEIDRGAENAAAVEKLLIAEDNKRK